MKQALLYLVGIISILEEGKKTVLPPTVPPAVRADNARKKLQFPRMRVGHRSRARKTRAAILSTTPGRRETRWRERASANKVICHVKFANEVCGYPSRSARSCR